MRVLFTTQPGSGHWRPLAPLARALAVAGHEVAFAATPICGADVGAHGFRTFVVGEDDWLRPTPQQASAAPAQAAEVIAGVFAPRAGRDLGALLAVARNFRPDVIVREQTEFAGCLAAEYLGLPHAALLVSAFRGAAVERPLASVLDGIRRAAGLPPDPELAMLYRYLLLAPVSPRLHDPAIPLPPTMHAIRHVLFDLERPGEDRLPAWTDGLGARPVVYATLGTAYNRTPGLFDTLLAGLRDEPIDLIVALGPGLEPAAFGPQPANIRLVPYLPQSLIFGRCDLVVAHGGSGTLRTALAHGLPLVLLPVAADQPDNARRGAALGVARIIPPDERSPAAIRAAVRAVLSDPTYRANARRLRTEFAALPPLEHAVALLERLAAERRPIFAER